MIGCYGNLDKQGGKMQVDIGVGDFCDRHSILSLKKLKRLPVDNELKQYIDEKPDDTFYDYFYNILQSVNSQLWDLEDRKRKEVERYSHDESDVAYIITQLNDLRSEVKKRIDNFYEGDIKEVKSYEVY